MDRKVIKAIRKLSAIAILAIVMIATTYNIAWIAFSVPGPGEPVPSWYYSVDGVLNTDTYSLYPYEKRNITVGFSIFGELIDNLRDNSLNYGGVKVFSPADPSIPKEIWYQGWLINITYYNGILGQWRNVWATAVFADPMGFTAFGGNWLRVQFPQDCMANAAQFGDSGAAGSPGCEDPTDKGYLYDPNPQSPTFGMISSPTLYNGGRKTNGTVAIPTDMPQFQILYDGPRRFIARMAWDIYDFTANASAGNIPLVRLIITLDFDKTTKVVKEIKEVKSLLNSKIGTSMFIQLSNRGEIDLGNVMTGYRQLAHFFTTGNCSPIDNTTEGIPTVYKYNDWSVNDKWGYVRNATNDILSQPWPVPPPNIASATCFTYNNGSKYDVLQSLNPDASMIFFAAFWPALNDWTLFGFPMRWRSLDAADPHYIDSIQVALAQRPFYIAEWDTVLYAFDLFTGNPTQFPAHFRALAVYGLIDNHEISMANYDKRLDREVVYLLTQVFNPFDLVKASEKDTARWVNFFTAPGPTNLTLYIPERLLNPADGSEFSDRVPVPASWYWDRDFTLEFGNISSITNRTEKYDDWYVYSTFSERVLLGSTLLDIGLYSEVNVTNITFGNTFFKAIRVPAPGSYKILFSTDYKCAGEYSWINVTVITANMRTSAELIVCYKDIISGFNFSSYVIVNGSKIDLSQWSLSQPNMYTYIFTNQSFNLVDPMLDLDYKAIESNRASFLARGAYEWIVVGRDSHPVDSAGAAAVSEAFASIKDILIQWNGLDMRHIDLNVPFVLQNFSSPATGPRANYRYTSTDLRTAFRDDWSRSVAIASSNIIAVGGPGANLVAEYFNEFSPIILSSWTGMMVTNAEAYMGTIVTATGRHFSFGGPFMFVNPPHWRAGFTTQTVDDGVVFVFKDLNGTVGLVIYGISGQTTWAIAQSFFEPTYITYFIKGEQVRKYTTLIQVLQDLNDGTVALRIRVTYIPLWGGDPHPVLTIVENLGTFTEKPIHPDP